MEYEISKNKRRKTGSGLAGVRPEAVRLGPVEHIQSLDTAPASATGSERITKTYPVVDQLDSQRLAVREGERAKNNWTGH